MTLRDVDEPAEFLRRLVARPEWMAGAACVGDERLFGSDDASSAAIFACEMCPLIRRCLRHAVALRLPHGVWGGMSPTQRRRVRAAVIKSINKGNYL